MLQSPRKVSTSRFIHNPIIDIDLTENKENKPILPTEGDELKPINLSFNEDNSYSCKKCGKRFGEKWRLKRHMVVHEKIKPFTCPICKEAFNYKQTMERHFNSYHVSKGNCKVEPLDEIEVMEIDLAHKKEKAVHEIDNLWKNTKGQLISE